jgi:hypothetical protein
MQLRSIVALTLAAAFANPLGRAGDPAQRLAELEKRFQEERAGWSEFRRQARTLAERAEVNASFPSAEFAAEFTAIAEAAKGTEVAAKAWYGLFRLGLMVEERESFGRGLETLLASHVKSPLIGNVMADLVYGAPEWTVPAAQDALRKIVAGTDSNDIRAEALVELAMMVGLDPSLGEKGRKEALELLGRIEREYGDKDFNAMNGRQFAAGARFEIEKLGLGMVAPDFEITDQEGARFKLSDYRGRVVVLDFWGFV